MKQYQRDHTLTASQTYAVSVCAPIIESNTTAATQEATEYCHQKRPSYYHLCRARSSDTRGLIYTSRAKAKLRLIQLIEKEEQSFGYRGFTDPPTNKVQ
eukprot:jgi/Psemu1/310810/fgenesh1_kg.683_\